MKAVTTHEFGSPDVLRLREVAPVHAGPGEVVVAVTAAGVNRADTLQRQGYYPPPPGVSDVIGLECSGVISEVGPGVADLQVGDEVCALLAGGGYASHVVVPAPQVMPVPAGIDLVSAAALPEVAATVWSNVFTEAALSPGETLLVHGGAGGIGSFAVQLAHALGHRVLTTVGSEAKAARCRELGADVVVNHREQDFVQVVREDTDGRGVDVVLDVMGGSHLDRNLAALATGGRVAVIGMQGGTKGELNLGRLMQKRARVLATSLRPRPVEEKGRICTDVVARVWPLVAAGRVKPVIDTVLPLHRAAEAHERISSSEHTGKILLTVADAELTP